MEIHLFQLSTQISTFCRADISYHHSYSCQLSTPERETPQVFSFSSSLLNSDCGECRIAIVKDRPKWRQLTHSEPKPPDA